MITSKLAASILAFVRSVFRLPLTDCGDQGIFWVEVAAGTAAGDGTAARTTTADATAAATNGSLMVLRSTPRPPSFEQPTRAAPARAPSSAHLRARIQGSVV